MKNDTLNIVLADDDEDDRDIFEQALNETKHQTHLECFENGLSLINYLRHNDTELPDVIFLDLNMPSMDGFECLGEIKKDPGLKDLIIIIYSTSSSEKDIDLVFNAGANIYLTKPYDFGKLVKILQKILALDWPNHSASLSRTTFLYKL